MGKIIVRFKRRTVLQRISCKTWDIQGDGDSCHDLLGYDTVVIW